MQGFNVFLFSLENSHIQWGLKSPCSKFWIWNSFVPTLPRTLALIMRFQANLPGKTPSWRYAKRIWLRSYFRNNRPVSTKNPVCLLGLILNDVSLFKNIVLTQKFEFNRHNCPNRTNYRTSYSTSTGNIAKRPILVRMFKDCIRLMQNLCARSSISNSVDVSADLFLHPCKALGIATAL